MIFSYAVSDMERAYARTYSRVNMEVIPHHVCADAGMGNCWAPFENVLEKANLRAEDRCEGYGRRKKMRDLSRMTLGERRP